MKKFAKTSYTWQNNHKGFVKNSHNKQETGYSNYPLHQKSPPKDHTKQQQQFHQMIDKKLDIDPSLLFNKKNGRTGNGDYRRSIEKKVRVQREFASTSTGGFYKPSRERPQSKQQSRVKIIKNNNSLEKPSNQIQRPQTSKGQRNIVYNREEIPSKKKTLGNQEEDLSIQVKRTVKTASGGGRRGNTKRLELQTSIDPQFLALFAS